MAHKLTEGALQTIMSGGEVLNPVVQILDHKVITQGNAPSERYRLLISDGLHFHSFAMLATQLNDKVSSGELADFSIIRINRHIVSMVNNAGRGEKRVMIILDLTVLAHGSQIGIKIGNPTNCIEGGVAPPAPAVTVNGSATKQQQPACASNTNAVSGVGNRYSTGGGGGAGLLNSSISGDVATHPIASLSPYQNKWVIKARVTSKSPIRTWSNPRGEGKLFSIDLVDESGEIRATAFKEQCDKFYDMIEPNKVYMFSRCSLKTANKKFSNMNNDYEMSFTSETQVVPCAEDDASIPQLQFSFVPLIKLQEAQPDSLIDVIGVCKSTSDVVSLTSRTTNRELKKRDIHLVDQSLALMTVTLWGPQAELFDGSAGPIVAVKGARVSEFGGGRSLSLVTSSTLQLNPDIGEAHRLRGWFDSLSNDAQFSNLSAAQGGRDSGSDAKWITLKEARDSQLGSGDKPDYFNTFATVIYLRAENATYKACPTPDCNKKVIDQNTGMYRCEKCNREFDTFKFRLMLSAQVGDWTSSQWVTLFQEAAEPLLGITAQEVGEIRESGDDAAYNEIFRKATFRQFLFRLRAKLETFNDETKLKVIVQNLKSADFNEYSRRLITEIKQMAGIGAAKAY